MASQNKSTSCTPSFFRKSLSLLMALSFVGSQVLLSIPQGYAQQAPYQKTFVITAYYSPLPDQSFYVTGSYYRDKVLNGNGTHGASGTPVFDGMIAAPSTYAFGTQIDCGEVFSGTVTDRGGAIVKAGDSYSNFGVHAHDRLDIWAGRGTPALMAALHWGKRTLNCTVYPPGHEKIAQFTNLPAGRSLPKAQSIPSTPKTSSTPVVSSDSTPNSYYQGLFEKLGYDGLNKDERIAFQKRHGLIDDLYQADAGYVGPKTKAKLEELSKEEDQVLPQEGLQEGDVSGEVRTLQELLITRGYLDEESTAIFGPKTKEALIQFQIDKGLIEDASHPAAGYVGPGTVAAFKENKENPHAKNQDDEAIIQELVHERDRVASLAKADELEAPSVVTEEIPEDLSLEALELLRQEWIEYHTPAEILENIQGKGEASFQLASSVSSQKEYQDLVDKLTPVMVPFEQKLSFGSVSPQVTKIQELLFAAGHYDGEIYSNYFGTKTKQAVIDFQMASGIIESIYSPGAGIVGPKTLKALNATHYQENFSQPFEVTESIRAPAIHPDDLKFTENIQHALSDQKI